MIIKKEVIDRWILGFKARIVARSSLPTIKRTRTVARDFLDPVSTRLSHKGIIL